MAFKIKCPNCGYEGPGKIKYNGSTAVGCLLLLLFIIPGLIYAVWQSSTRHAECPQCKWRNVAVTEGSIGISSGAGCAFVAVIFVIGFMIVFWMAQP